MNKLFANVSADLRRISYWIYDGRDNLADKFLSLDKEMLKGRDIKIGKSTLQKELKKITSGKEDRQKRSERALTVSLLLQHKVIKE